MDIKVPEVGESILEALVANWLKNDGDRVTKDEIICELETDKINVELPAEASGTLHIVVEEGKTVEIGTVIATLDESGDSEQESTNEDDEPEQEPTNEGDEPEQDKEKDTERQKPSGKQQEKKAKTDPEAEKDATSEAVANPAARQKAEELGVNLKEVQGSGRSGRVTLDDVLGHERVAGKEKDAGQDAGPSETAADDDRVTREPMTPIRQRIAARLLEARQQTAMLTTFNDADMSWIKKLRSRHQEHFKEKHGVKLGIMSFFVKACVEALKEFPTVNAKIDGTDIVYQHFYDIGIAVGTERGLVVPVLRDADQLTFSEIEQQIAALAEKANARKLTMADLEGGTFTITNGGVYGSLLSTPIINPPQCGVLGMHSIQDRPVVVDGEIVIKPIMNLALSYDHRLIDGREAVGFLKTIKEYIEDPSELFLEL